MTSPKIEFLYVFVMRSAISRPNIFSDFHFNVVGNWIAKAWLNDPGLINVQFEMSSMLLQG